MSLSSGNTLRRGISAKFDDEKEKMRQLFQPIKKVSLTVDIWTTTNNLAIIGITIHWIDDLWKLHECVLAVKELCGSHGGVEGYYVAYKPITLPCILFMFIEMKFIHCHSCVMFKMKSMSMCND